MMFIRTIQPVISAAWAIGRPTIHWIIKRR
jgi:hypothetical protein